MDTLRSITQVLVQAIIGTALFTGALLAAAALIMLIA